MWGPVKCIACWTPLPVLKSKIAMIGGTVILWLLETLFWCQELHLGGHAMPSPPPPASLHCLETVLVNDGAQGRLLRQGGLAHLCISCVLHVAVAVIAV